MFAEDHSAGVIDSFDFSRLGPPVTKADSDEDEGSEIASHYEDYEDEGEFEESTDKGVLYFSNLMFAEDHSADVRGSFDFSRLGPPATKADSDEDEGSDIAPHYEDYEDEREFEESIDQGGAFVII
jgi:hypothetical protein